MASDFEVTTTIDRPIAAVFAFLAQGTNDPAFSPRVQEIHQVTDGAPGVGTVFASTVKDAGMTTKREFELTEFEAPTKIRWVERSKNSVTVTTGGYDLSAHDGHTHVRLFNELEGHGLGKLIVGFAVKSARKGADAFGAAIKRAAEAA
jgi:carbon monoxide dehydrogenase subunit G